MHGNLEKKLVARDFWPACGNCRHAETCTTHPQHPAYPHTWHWGREAVPFSDGELIVRSWVGTVAIGQPHTGCYSYEVHTQYLSTLRAHHQHYLTLEAERERLETVFERLERKETWTPQDEAVFATLLAHYQALLAERDALCSGTADTQFVAVAANA